MTSADAALNPPLISLIISATDAGEFFTLLTRIENRTGWCPARNYRGLWRRCRATLLAADAMPNRLPTLRFWFIPGALAFVTGGPLGFGRCHRGSRRERPHRPCPRGTAGADPADQSAMAIASTPHGAGLLAILDFLLADVAGMQALYLSPASGPTPAISWSARKSRRIRVWRFGLNSASRHSSIMRHLSVLQSAVRRADHFASRIAGSLLALAALKALARARHRRMRHLAHHDFDRGFAAITFVPGPEWGRLVDVAAFRRRRRC